MFHILYFQKAVSLLKGRIFKSLIFYKGQALYSPAPNKTKTPLSTPHDGLRLRGVASKTFHDLALFPFSCNSHRSVLHPPYSRLPEHFVLSGHIVCSILSCHCSCSFCQQCPSTLTARGSLYPSFKAEPSPTSSVGKRPASALFVPYTPHTGY